MQRSFREYQSEQTARVRRQQRQITGVTRSNGMQRSFKEYQSEQTARVKAIAIEIAVVVILNCTRTDTGTNTNPLNPKP